MVTTSSIMLNINGVTKAVVSRDFPLCGLHVSFCCGQFNFCGHAASSGWVSVLLIVRSCLPWRLHDAGGWNWVLPHLEEIDGETVETVADFIFGGSKITADGDFSHEIKRHLLLGRKVMTNLDSVLKSRDITLPAKGRLSQSYGFSSGHVWM